MGRSSRLRRAAAGTPRTCLFCVAKPSASLPQRKGCLQVSVDSIYNHQKPLQSHLLLSRGLAAIQPSCSCCLHLAAADPGGGWWPRRTSRGTDRQCHRGDEAVAAPAERHRLFPARHVPVIPRSLPAFPPLSRQKEGGRRGFARLGRGRWPRAAAGLGGRRAPAGSRGSSRCFSLFGRERERAGGWLRRAGRAGEAEAEGEGARCLRAAADEQSRTQPARRQLSSKLQLFSQETLCPHLNAEPGVPPDLPGAGREIPQLDPPLRVCSGRSCAGLCVSESPWPRAACRIALPALPLPGGSLFW